MNPALQESKNNYNVDFNFVSVEPDDKKSLHIRRVILCLGSSLTNLSASNDADLGFESISSSFELIELIETWNADGFGIPDAILVEDTHLAKLNADAFAQRRRKSKLRNAVLIVFSRDENDLVRHAAFSIEADDYCYGTPNAPEILRKIDFLKQLKNIGLDRKSLEFNKRIPRRNYYQKRLFDIVFASSALILATPLFILISILIKIESKGPVFYISKRAGFGFKVFDFYKFRTMRDGADKELSKLNHLNQYNGEGDRPSFFKVKNDPRVTSLGKLLRNSSLDELPQLINVLKGDMSIVGNRPLPLYEAQQLTNDDCAERFLAYSGLTGLWQVLKRGTEEISNSERILLDKIYARKSSIWFDIKIIAMTLPALVQKESV